MKQFRVYFIRDGRRLTKLVNADTLSEVKKMFKKVTVIRISQIDCPLSEEDEI